jgi:hypothetical protein
MRMIEIEPTVFLKRSPGGLQQQCRVTIENDGPPGACTITGDTERSAVDTFVEHVPAGPSTHEVFIKDITEPGPVTFVVKRAGQTSPSSERVLDWRPAKRWRVHVVQTSHHDVGYTDLASRVLPQHADYLDAAIDMAWATRDFPEDARFRIVIEAAWSLLAFLRSKPEGRVRRMIDLLRAGRIELAALFGNLVTELCGHEVLARSLYPAFRLKREFGVPLTSAEHNDIPGISWGLCRVLADAGVSFFCPGLPLYYSWSGEDLPSFWDEEAVFGRRGPGAFWWESPSGKRVLFWCNNSGCGGDCRPTLPGLADRLRQLEAQGYPYDVLRWPVLGAARDNSPYIEDYAHTIRAWNERWAYPHLICGTNATFYEEFGKQVPRDLPVRRGELPGQDYPVGAMSTSLATTVNRNNHVRIPVAEALATIASSSTDLRYPRETIDQAVEETLWYDEHTWGHHFPAGPTAWAGQLEKAVHAHRAAALAHDVAAKALARIADHVRRDEPGLYLVVFNPLPFLRTDPAAAPFREIDNCGSEIVAVPADKDPNGSGYLRGVLLTDRWHVNPDPAFAKGKFDLVDLTTGRGVRYQIREIGSSEDTVPYAAERFGLAAGAKRYGFFEVPRGLRRDLCFIAEDVPSFGYKTYRLVPRDTPQEHPAPNGAQHVIENEYYRIEIDRETSRIRRIHDQELDRDLIDPGAGEDFAGVAIRVPQGTEGLVLSRGKPEAAPVGPISATLKWTTHLGDVARVVHTVTLHRGIRRIDVAVRVLRDPRPLQDLHLVFPFAVTDPRFRYEGVLSTMNPIADYLPGSQSNRIAVQNWVKIAGKEMTVLWSSVDSPIVSFGRLWPDYVSPAHRCVPLPAEKNPPLTEADLNRAVIYSNLFNNNFQTNFVISQCDSVLFRYVVTTRAGDVSDAEAHGFGLRAVAPFETIFTDRVQEPLLPPDTGFLSIEDPAVSLLACKRAEDEQGIVLRLWNTASHAVRTRVETPCLSIAHVVRTTLTEESTDDRLESNAQGFLIELGAREVATVRVLTVSGLRG